jgi:hypothetical protein
MEGPLSVGGGRAVVSKFTAGGEGRCGLSALEIRSKKIFRKSAAGVKGTCTVD